MGGLWYVIIVFFALFFLRLPIAMVLICSTIVGLWFAPTAIPLSTLPTTLWQGVNHFVLMAIPFFILMGDLALASGVTQRLVNLAKAFVGHIAGGLAHVGVIVNIIMAGMSGSDLADAAATGRLLIPAMQRSGYPVGYAASLIAGAATIGPLIPPSIAFILFAAATDESVGRLFLGGAIPGAMLGLFLMVQAYFVAKRNGYPREERMPYGERVKATVVGLPVLVTNWTQFTQTFGEFVEGSYLAHAIYAYFLNGGGQVLHRALRGTCARSALCRRLSSRSPFVLSRSSGRSGLGRDVVRIRLD
jgi:C4-dicarboxylate transporter DctM subunit